MASAIDDTKPVTGTPTTQSVRDNFAAAKSEITALQAAVPTWTVGSVPFATSATALGQDNANLFYDNANDRLGIGTAAPSHIFHVHSATNVNFKLFNNAGNMAIAALNDANNAWGVLDVNPSGNVLLSSNAGNVGIGTSTTTAKLTVWTATAAVSTYIADFNNTHATAGDYVMRISAGPATTDSASAHILFFNSGNSVWMGGIQRNGAASVSYLTTSDERLKEDIKPTSAGLPEVMKIHVRDYSYRGDRRVEQGVLAQEIHEIYPIAVHAGGDDPNLEPWAIDYGRLTPLLIKAIQDLKAEVDELQAKLAGATPAR